MSETYDDGTIVCGTDRLEIHSYYFPFGTKSVPYTQIKGLQRIEIKGLWSGKWRFWGTGNPRYWANLDRKRSNKRAGFIVDLGRKVSPHRHPRQARRVRVRAPQPSEPRSGQCASDEGPLHLTGRPRRATRSFQTRCWSRCDIAVKAPHAASASGCWRATR